MNHYIKGPFCFIDNQGISGAHIPADFELLWKAGIHDEEITLATWNKGDKEEKELEDFINWIKKED